MREAIPGHIVTINSQGKKVAVSIETGEEKEVETVLQIKGSATIPPDEIERTIQAREKKAKFLQEQKKREQSYGRKSPMGKYFFVRPKEQFEDIPPETVAKLIYLSAYLWYDGRLKITKRRYMKREDLKEVLNMSGSSVWRLWRVISPKYLYEDEEGFLCMNPVIFRRGNLKRKNFVRWQQCYINGIKSLYEALDKRNHKHMGYLFQLLRYVHPESNILCRCPWEEELDKICPLTLKEFCEEIGYDYSHVSSLLSLYRSIRFSIGGRKERLVSIVSDGLDRKNAKIVINPHIIYNGEHPDKVEYYGAFCK